MRLEALARSAPKGGGAYNMDNCDGFIDPSPLFRSIVNELEKGIAVEIIARRAHEAIAVAFSRAAHNAASDAGADTDYYGSPAGVSGALSGLHYIIDPTGWGIQLDMNFEAQPSGCSNSLLGAEDGSSYNPACDLGTC